MQALWWRMQKAVGKEANILWSPVKLWRTMTRSLLGNMTLQWVEEMIVRKGLELKSLLKLLGERLCSQKLTLMIARQLLKSLKITILTIDSRPPRKGTLVKLTINRSKAPIITTEITSLLNPWRSPETRTCLARSNKKTTKKSLWSFKRRIKKRGKKIKQDLMKMN